MSKRMIATEYGNIKTANYLINMDNLEAFNFLTPKFHKKIKLIYLDPPYNTGKKFDHYDDNLQHDEWLSSMKERLVKFKELLTEDGSIWISIDDDEAHYLKVLCDSIFGRNNFVASIIWQKKSAASNDVKLISDTHDYILVYAKKKESFKINLLPRTEKSYNRYKNNDNDPRGVWISSDLTVKTPSDKYMYPIITPSGRKVYPSSGRSWSMPKLSFDKLMEDNRIWFGQSGRNMPRLKRFLTDVKKGMVPKTIWLQGEVGDNQEAKRETKQINSNQVFTTPKPERLLQRIIQLATNPGDIVLDGYAGSGTTGAVAHRMHRNWIMVEINGVCRSHCLPRMKNIVDGKDISKINKLLNWEKGGGFTFLT